MSTPSTPIRITCPVCKVRLPADGTVCPDCGQDLAVLVREARRVDVLFNEGLAAARAGDDAAGIRRLEDALTLAPQRTDVLDLLARLYLRRGLRTDALATWKRLLQLTPDDAAAKNAVRELEAAEKSARDRAQSSARARQRRVIGGASAAGLALGAAVAGAAFLLRPSPPPAAPAPAAVIQPTATTLPPTPTPPPTAVPPTATVLPTATPIPTAAPLPTATPFPDYTAKMRDALAAFAIRNFEVMQDGVYVILRGEVASLPDKDDVESAAKAVHAKVVSELVIAKTYEVKPGDTFYKIARLVNRDAKAIAEANKMALKDSLAIGKKLLIP